jgi:hypothetical protein
MAVVVVTDVVVVAVVYDVAVRCVRSSGGPRPAVIAFAIINI